MNIRPLVAVLFAVAGIPLFADTLAWYHFDEVAPGEKPTPETRFLNAVDPTVAPGRPISQIDWWEDKTGTHFPQGAVAFPDGFSVLDPVSGDALANARALVFTTGKREDDYYGASGVEIANDPASTTGKLTYECFVRFDLSRTPDGKGNNCKRIILAKGQDDDGVGFKIVYDYWDTSGRNIMVFVNSDPNPVLNAPSVYLDDGKWHHIAVTFDAADSSVRVYVDYAQVGEATGLAADLSKMSNKYLTVGFAQYDSSWPRWGGIIDELRISDAALTPQQMLKVQSSSVARPVDKDTAAYQSFSLGDEFALTMHMRNEVIGDGSLGEPSFYAKGNAPTWCPDVPIRQIGTSEGLVENTGSSSFTGTAKGWAFEDPSATLIQGDYTAEMFFRTSDEYSSDCYLMAQDGAMVLKLLKGGLQMNWWSCQASGNFYDGKWHHVALVYVKADEKYDLYVDYTYRGSKESSPSPETAEKAFRFGGYGAYYNEPFRDIDIDEVRITRRALGPDEFIHPFEPDVAWFISGDPDDWAQCQSWSMPDLPDYSRINCDLDSEVKAGDLVASGLLSEPVTNVASLRVLANEEKAQGIRLLDSDHRIATGSFTAELSFRINSDSQTAAKADNYLLFQDGDEWDVHLYDGNLYYQYNWGQIAKITDGTPCDGQWHHVAFVQDCVSQRLLVYYDYKRVGSANAVLDSSKVKQYIWVGNDAWSGKNLKDAWIDNIRITRKALKPCEFLTSKHVDGPTLAWAYFDNGDGSFAQKYDEAATYSGAATFASRGAGAEVLDAEGNVLRENQGSLRMLSGAASYSRLSLLERTDLTAELFFRAAAIADGTDVLSLTVKDASPVWSLRAVNGVLKVFAGEVAVADAGTIPASWTHFAVAFDPAADGSSTAVKVYRDHELVDEQSFTGTLAVDGLKDSSLKIGSFDGAVDELRFSKGALGVADMLYRPKPDGMLLIIR